MKNTLLALAALLMPVGARAETFDGPGCRSITTKESVDGKTLPAVLWLASTTEQDVEITAYASGISQDDPDPGMIIKVLVDGVAVATSNTLNTAIYSRERKAAVGAYLKMEPNREYKVSAQAAPSPSLRFVLTRLTVNIAQGCGTGPA